MNIVTGIPQENYFEDAEGIGILGVGETIDGSFTAAAKHMFALMHDVNQIHFTQIITFEFTEIDLEQALLTWLSLLLAKSKEHQLMFGDFRLKREGNLWKATVSGEKNRLEIKRDINVEQVLPGRASVTKIEHHWCARMVVKLIG